MTILDRIMEQLENESDEDLLPVSSVGKEVLTQMTPLEIQENWLNIKTLKKLKMKINY